MAAIAPVADSTRGAYRGLRLTAEEYFSIPDDGARYELVDGVVVVSPSPEPNHQYVSGQLFRKLADFVEARRLGVVLYETDVLLSEGPTGGDVVLRPEFLFVRVERQNEVRKRVVGAPDLVVEVVSPDSRRMDTRTKYDDYQRAGVQEYWLIDPERDEMRFYRLEAGRFVEAPISGDKFASTAVPGFTLDLAWVRETFRGW